MSWSVALIGKPENVVARLKAISGTMQGQSKEEYDGALPHLIGIVEQNFSKLTGPVNVKIQASGSGYSNNGEHQQRSCSVSIDPNYGEVV